MQFLFFAGQQAFNTGKCIVWIHVHFNTSSYVRRPKKPIIVTIDFRICLLKQNVFHICMYVPLKVNTIINICIKTHGRVSAAKEVMWHTSVLFTGTAKSPFSTPHISITTGPISIKLTYFMPSIYTTLHTKFEENRLSSL